MTQETRAMTVPDDTALAPRFIVAPADIKQRIQELREFVGEYMQEGEDYGTIPGTQKPTLYKSGGEKLCDVYGFSRQFEVTHRVEDWDRGLFHYEVRADLVNMRTGLLVAQGLGSANSKEERYRWRSTKPTCKSCGMELRRSKQQEEWYCWQKKGGCGATYPLADIPPAQRIENDEPFTLVNTLLKMAKKRALVDAVLSATRSSGIFTQDIEDFIEGEVIAETSVTEEPARPAPRPARTAPARAAAPTEGDRDRSALFGQAALMWPDKDAHAAICRALNLPEIGEGSLTKHWLERGGTYKNAQAALAEVRRIERGRKLSLEDAAAEVNAYGALTALASE